MPTDREQTQAEPSSSPFLPRKMTVYCTEWASCGWHGKRRVERHGVQPEPCPKCGKAVTA